MRSTNFNPLVSEERCQLLRVDSKILVLENNKETESARFHMCCMLGPPDPLDGYIGIGLPDRGASGASCRKSADQHLP